MVVWGVYSTVQYSTVQYSTVSTVVVWGVLLPATSLGKFGHRTTLGMAANPERPLLLSSGGMKRSRRATRMRSRRLGGRGGGG